MSIHCGPAQAAIYRGVAIGDLFIEIDHLMFDILQLQPFIHRGGFRRPGIGRRRLRAGGEGEDGKCGCVNGSFCVQDCPKASRQVKPADAVFWNNIS